MRRLMVMFSVLLTTNSIAYDQLSVWDKLMARAQTEDERLITRMTALSLACENADAVQATETISMLSQWTDTVEQTETATSDTAGADTPSARQALLSHAVGHGAERLNAIGDSAAALDLWRRLSSQPWATQVTKEKAFELIASNPSSIAARQEAAIAALRDSGVGRSGQMPQAFASLLDQTAISALRTLVRESADIQTFNYAAAATLAEFGDLDILSELHALQAPFAEADVCSGDALGWYAWQIEIQNPPSQLLTHIASPELFTAESRCWAIRKAAELGLSTEDIREAIEDYESAGRPFGPNQQPAGIAEMKAVAMKLGIIAEAVFSDAIPGTSPAYETNQVAWNLSTPVVDWIPPWEPRYENYPAFFEWCEAQPWDELDDETGARLFSERLCELELLPPDSCGIVAETVNTASP
ncbi:MAG: hypothetical protein KF841_03185 [Phycisphaerae bacterium]|nr:hypothetical protein [Phycisphaerae bacterium]